MKIKYSFVLIAVMALMLVVTGVLAATGLGVSPTEFSNMDIGDAAHYCVTTLGYDWGLKIEVSKSPGADKDLTGSYKGEYDSKGMLHEDFDNEITLSNATRTSFNWTSDPYAISAVVVQGSTMDNVFFYALPNNETYAGYTSYGEAVWGDDGLYPYDSDSNKRDFISQLNFCWNKTNENGDEECYADETAWAYGPDYIDAEQWAMYVPYSIEGLSVALMAGQHIDAGIVTFSAPVDGWVTITINLDNNFVFYYDLGDEELDDNLKVQDYEFPPEGNPAIGHFDWKVAVPGGSTTAEIIVPANNYYGVHLDVAQLVDCELED